jgi:hypothetical protein
MIHALRRVPAWAWLAGLVLLSFGLRLALSRHFPSPWIFNDELTYIERARSFVADGSFDVRGQPIGGLSRVYPVLLAPAYALFDSQTAAYAAAKATNAALVSLAAIPIYLLARRLVRPALALLTAALSLALPALFFSSIVMTESAFYLLSPLVAYALVLTLERPTTARQLALLAVCAVAFLTRTEALALGPAVLTATALAVLVPSRAAPSGARLRAFLTRLADFRILWLVLVVIAVAAVLAQLARGRAIGDLFGVYAAALSTDYPAGESARWFVDQLVTLDVIVGVVPFAAFVLVVFRLFDRDTSLRVRSFAAASLALVFWFTLVIAVFSSEYATGLEERLLFHLAPLLFVSFVLWIEEGAPRTRLVIAALVAILLPLGFSYADRLTPDGVAAALGLWPLLELREDGLSLRAIEAIVVGGAFLLGAAFLLLRGRWRLLPVPLLIAYFALASGVVEDRMRAASLATLGAGIGTDRNWIDRAIGPGGSAVGVWSPTNLYVDWTNEVFSASLGRAYALEELPDGLPHTVVRVDATTGELFDSDGRPIESEYAVVEPNLALAAPEVAADPVLGTRVYRPDGPLVALERVTGRYADGYSGPVLDYTRYACQGGRLDVAFTTNSLLVTEPQTVAVSVGGQLEETEVVGPGAVDQPAAVELIPDADGACRARFLVSPTVVPNDVLGNGDTRELGVQFTDLRYSPGG